MHYPLNMRFKSETEMAPQEEFPDFDVWTTQALREWLTQSETALELTPTDHAVLRYIAHIIDARAWYHDIGNVHYANAAYGHAHHIYIHEIPPERRW